MKNVLTNFLLSIFSGLLMAFSWPEIGDLEGLIFFSFIPLLFLENKISLGEKRRKGLKVFGYSYLTFLIFNFITTWWIRLASFEGMIMAVVFNALFMALVFQLFYFTKKKINAKVGYASLVFYWVAFEYLHINWELSWIWLNLGNVFANKISWIQWYEYTGSLGGSFWILSVNSLLFFLFQSALKSVTKRVFFARVTALILVVSGPLFTSLWIFSNYEEKSDPVHVILIQPNIDPYNDKFGGMSEKEQIDRLIRLSSEKIDVESDLIFGPETAFPNGIWEHELDQSYGVIRARELIESYPNIKFIVGLSSIQLYENGDEITHTARPYSNTGMYYDYYNSVMQMDGSGKHQIYRKSKLVLGVEKMPFIAQFDFMKNLSINLGGASGSLGSEKEPKVFTSKTKDGRDIRVIPAICYESIYGEFLTEFVRKGGNLLGVVTNDGWWGSTPGYKQHLAYSRLRAIELRRSVARSANTGISAFINQKGEIQDKTEWWVEDSLSGTINLNNEITFYAKHGDFIGRMAAFFAVLLLVWTFVKRQIHSPTRQ